MTRSSLPLKATGGMSESSKLGLGETVRLGLIQLPWWLSSKESAYDAEDAGLTPGSGRSPGEGNGFPMQYSCLENSMDRGAWRTIVQVLDTSERLAFYFDGKQTDNTSDSDKKKKKKTHKWFQ